MTIVIGSRVQVRDQRDGAIVFTGVTASPMIAYPDAGHESSFCYVVQADDRNPQWAGFAARIPAACVELLYGVPA